MKITRVLINRCSQNNLIAYVNVVFDDCLIVRGCRIVEKPDHTKLLVMPSRQTKMGEFKDVCHPINSSFRKILETRIFSELDSKPEINVKQREHSDNLGDD